MTAQLDIQARRAGLQQRYSRSGLPLTAQRRAMLDVLAERTDHPTVDQIHLAVVERLPEVSRTTVYRSLETFAEQRVILRVEHPGSAVRFDPNTDPHHHFLCLRCGSLADLPLEAVAGCDGLSLADESLGRVEEIAILVRGTCAACGDER